MIDMGRKARAAGIKLSVTVLLGLAGRERSRSMPAKPGGCYRPSTRIRGCAQPDADTGHAPHDQYQNGTFDLIEPDEMLAELRTMIAETHQTKGMFHANHASNYLPIRARMPKEKAQTLALIDQALAGKVELRPNGCGRCDSVPKITPDRLADTVPTDQD